jgi:4-carboxymuconolactone decarboxylase
LAYVDAPTRVGRLDEARTAFEKMLTSGNHVGLYSEEIALTGEQIGDFPQAFTRLALIDAAVTPDAALDGRPAPLAPGARSSGTGDDGRRRADEAGRAPIPSLPGGAMTQTAPDNVLGRIAAGDAPVLETLLEMNLDAAERSGLDAETYLLVRLAALVAMDAAPVSYLMTLGAAADTGLTVEKMQAVLVAIAPVVGSARVTAAAGAIVRGILGAEVLAEQVVPEQRTS